MNVTPLKAKTISIQPAIWDGVHTGFKVVLVCTDKIQHIATFTDRAEAHRYAKDIKRRYGLVCPIRDNINEVNMILTGAW